MNSITNFPPLKDVNIASVNGSLTFNVQGYDNVTVYYGPNPDVVNYSLGTRTVNQGIPTIVNVEPGEYYVLGKRRQYEHVDGYYINLGSLHKVTVSSGQTTFVKIWDEIVPPAIPVINGSLTLEVIGYDYVTVYYSKDANPVSNPIGTRSVSQGTPAIESVEPGEYYVQGRRRQYEHVDGYYINLGSTYKVIVSSGQTTIVTITDQVAPPTPIIKGELTFNVQGYEGSGWNAMVYYSQNNDVMNNIFDSISANVVPRVAKTISVAPGTWYVLGRRRRSENVDGNYENIGSTYTVILQSEQTVIVNIQDVGGGVVIVPPAPPPVPPVPPTPPGTFTSTTIVTIDFIHPTALYALSTDASDTTIQYFGDQPIQITTVDNVSVFTNTLTTSGMTFHVNESLTVGYGISYAFNQEIPVFTTEDQTVYVSPGTYKVQGKKQNQFGNWVNIGPQYSIVVPEGKTITVNVFKEGGGITTTGMIFHVVDMMVVYYRIGGNTRTISVSPANDKTIYVDPGTYYVQGNILPNGWTEGYTVAITEGQIIKVNVFTSGGGTSTSGMIFHVEEYLTVGYGISYAFNQEIPVYTTEDQTVYVSPGTYKVQGKKQNQFGNWVNIGPQYSIAVITGQVITVNVFSSGGGSSITGMTFNVVESMTVNYKIGGNTRSIDLSNLKEQTIHTDPGTYTVYGTIGSYFTPSFTIIVPEGQVILVYVFRGGGGLAVINKNQKIG